MTLTVGSLFAGIGGFDLGLERAGMEVKWQVEIDPFCRRVLEKHWPHVRRYEDVRKVHIAEPKPHWYCDNCLEPADVICGGFPCQDISNAGRRAGIFGERSGLFAEAVRLTDVLGPDYLLLENVAALLHGGMGAVLGALAAIGYDAEWDCIPASAVGAKHRRERIWIVAYPNGSRLERRDGGGVSERARQWLAGESRPPIFTTGPCGEWEPEPNVGRVAHGVPARVDRLRGLGNAIVPQIAQWIGERILACEQQKDCAK